MLLGDAAAAEFPDLRQATSRFLSLEGTASGGHFRGGGHNIPAVKISLTVSGKNPFKQLSSAGSTRSQ
jgi:hypothetical protein